MISVELRLRRLIYVDGKVKIRDDYFEEGVINLDGWVEHTSDFDKICKFFAIVKDIVGFWRVHVRFLRGAAAETITLLGDVDLEEYLYHDSYSTRRSRYIVVISDLRLPLTQELCMRLLREQGLLATLCPDVLYVDLSGSGKSTVALVLRQRARLYIEAPDWIRSMLSNLYEAFEKKSYDKVIVELVVPLPDEVLGESARIDITSTESMTKLT